jgi:HK97 family phage major capsid protein
LSPKIPKQKNQKVNKMSISVSAQQEIMGLQRECEEITKKPLSPESRKKFELNLSKVKLLGSGQLSDEVRMAQRDEIAKEFGLKKEDESGITELREYLSKGAEARTYSGMSVGTDSAGGYFVPQTFYKTVTFALKQMDGLWNDDVITLYEDTHGNALTCPLVDDTDAVATLVSENSAGTEDEIATIDRLSLGKVPSWRSGKLITSFELVEDAGFPLESAIIAPAVANRFQRGISAANAGTLISSITSGHTSGAASSASLEDCLSLMASVDPAYLASPKCFWAMNNATLIGLLGQKDSTGRYIWRPRADENGRLLVWEKPVVIMPSLPSAAPSAVGTVLIGDFSKCIRRIVRNSMTMLKYTNAPGLVEYGLLAYQTFLKTSFGVLSSTSSESPIKYLTQAAS